jgi:hypothetical protein
MERSAWTDERLDDFAASVRDELRLLRVEMHALRTEMHDEFRALRNDMLTLQRQIAQIGWTLAIAMIGAMVALVVAVA